MLERVDGRIDKAGSVVDGHDFDGLGQAARDFLEPLLHILNHVKGIDAKTLEHDPACDLSLAVQFGDAASLVGPNSTRATCRSSTGVPLAVFRTMLPRSLMLLT